MLVLAGVLLVNMLLLVPSLHADGPAGSSSSSSGGSTGWHLKGVPAAGPAAAVGPPAVPGRAKVGEQQQQQQQGMKQPPKGDFMQDFDANRDGVLGPAEFQTLLQVGAGLDWRQTRPFSNNAACLAVPSCLPTSSSRDGCCRTVAHISCLTAPLAQQSASKQSGQVRSCHVRSCMHAGQVGLCTRPEDLPPCIACRKPAATTGPH